MPENKRSVLVSAVAWVFILAGGWSSAAAAYDGFVLAFLFSSPGFMLGLAVATLPVGMPPLARLAAEHIPLVFVLCFLAWLSIFITGIGLLARKAWALTAFRWIFYIGGVCCLVIFLFPEVVVPKPYTYGGVSLAPEFNAAVGAIKFRFRLIAAGMGTALLWFARRFEKPEVRNEFGLK